MTTDDLQVDIPEQDVEVAESQDDVQSEETQVSDDKDWQAEAAKWKAIAQRNKRKQANPAQVETEQPIQTNNASFASREEAYLFAQGYSEEDVDQLSLVAKGTGLSLKEAREHPLFVAYIEKVQAEKRAKKAQMSTSKGSIAKKPVNIAGMTPEEHKAYWAERSGL